MLHHHAAPPSTPHYVSTGDSPSSECIAYERGRLDTHAAMQGVEYFFVQDHWYVVTLSSGACFEMHAKAGSSIRGDVESVIAESCGPFYRTALDQARGGGKCPVRK